ncbi:hypothetical protein [Vibrio navarrensis]|uniref:hypothetical protein n=1 Tax=Vibrio navarrensis TaxID=29495 RepID=UPI001D03A0D0|nr:hypothetical protein [Vibrio navarrensis]
MGTTEHVWGTDPRFYGALNTTGDPEAAATAAMLLGGPLLEGPAAARWAAKATKYLKAATSWAAKKFRGIFGKVGGISDDVTKRADISTGRTEAKSLEEQLAMEEVKSNPSGVTPPRMPKMSDTKNNLLHEDGWVKRTQNVNGVEIHYVENINTNEVIDFKFKD